MATKYARAAGGTWATDSTWSTTDGGGADTVAPVDGDDVIFSNQSGSVTVSATAPVSGGLLSLTFNGGTGYTGTITVNAALIVRGNVTLSSSMSSAGSSILIVNATANLTSNTHQWGAGLSLRTATMTLQDAWVLPSKPLATASSTATVNGFSITAAGLTIGANLQGSTTVTLSGGTWSATAGTMENSLTIAGDVTVSGTVAFANDTLTYSSGTVTTTGSTLSLGDSVTLNTAGISWNNVTCTSTSVTNNSLLTILGTLTLPNAAITFSGTNGFTTATLANTTLTGNRTTTLTQTNTYTVTTSITAAGNGANHLTLASSHGTNRVPFVFSGGTPPSLNLVRATRLDSSGGTVIYTNDTITDSLNWAAPVTGGSMWIFS